MALKLIIDSACDITPEKAANENITLVPFSVSLDGENYLQENIEISKDEFVDKMVSEEIFPKTSLPSIQLYYDAFEKSLKNNDDIICICLATKLSGSYQSAVNAKNNLLEDYPDANIIVVNSETATLLEYELAMVAKELYEKGKTLDEIEVALEKIRDNACIFFTIDNLNHLEKGGRIGKGAALAGKFLNVKPILKFADGEILPYKKVRGNKNAINTFMGEIAEIYKSCNGKCRLASIYGDNISVLGDMQDYFINKISDNIENLDNGQIGLTIGSHTGVSVYGFGILPYNIDEV